MFQLVTPRRAYQIYAACGLRIGMCGYTSVPKDGRICLLCDAPLVLAGGTI